MHRTSIFSSLARKQCQLILATATIVILMTQVSCKKLVQIDPPANTITTSEVFADSADAASALLGIYSQLINENGNISFGNGGPTLYAGWSSDELVNLVTVNQDYAQFYSNSLQPTTQPVYVVFWQPAYSNIYQLNAIMEGLQASTTVPDTTKNAMISEAKFLRAFYYLYLMSFFGDVPYVTSTSWVQNQNVSRTPKATLFPLLISDLQDAQKGLRADYATGNGERIRANSWTATALLARAYLYSGDYTDAVNQASAVINNNSLFSLCSDPNTVFLKNSSEAILQLQLNTAYAPYNATPEGDAIIPLDSTSYTLYPLTTQLLNAFEPGDLRRQCWVDSCDYLGTIYYYPYKYKVGPAQEVPNATPAEYYMVLRLAEQFLIRAEAEAMQGKTGPAITDLNTIRERALLPDLSPSLNQQQVMDALVQERRIELFAEWGHRWLDLQRTGKIDSVMTSIDPSKGGTWNSEWALYPIPYTESLYDPNLKQNPGY